MGGRWFMAECTEWADGVGAFQHLERALNPADDGTASEHHAAADSEQMRPVRTGIPRGAFAGRGVLECI